MNSSEQFLVQHFKTVNDLITLLISQDQRKRQTAGEGEADEEAEFAAAVLDLVHKRVRDVGNVFRVVGDTAGVVAGGSINAVGAGVHVSSYRPDLDLASALHRFENCGCRRSVSASTGCRPNYDILTIFIFGLDEPV